MEKNALRRFVLLFACAFLPIGCTRGPRIAEVEGTVTAGGKPLPNIRVQFVPEVEGPRSSGSTDENGHYVLTLEEDKEENRAGAVVGVNRVVLQDLDVWGGRFLGRAMEHIGDPGGPKLKPSRINSKYTDPARTPLRNEVLPQPQTIDIKVTR